MYSIYGLTIRKERGNTLNKSTADIGERYKLKFLFKKGEYEIVGAYYRNKRMKEAFNSYLKQHAGFESNLPRKGEKIAFFHTTLCLLSLNLVALTRLQNGTTENLVSVAYLT